MPITWLDPDRLDFPSLDQAARSPNGLLAVGGDLSPERLLAAYRHGVFPWYEAGQPPLWWSPDPRMVLFPERLHHSASFRKFLRHHDLRASFDTDFSGVIQGCAAARKEITGTWITPEMQHAYTLLHHRQVAHSVEIWEATRLVGGLYGIALGSMFFGESMFSLRSNASKLALAFLVRHLQLWGYRVIDCQVASRHLSSLGAEPISRAEFRRHLLSNLNEQGKLGHWEPVLSAQQLHEF
jgi:leucyl/phenylalanyl-tRNA--protein transferase